MDPPTIRSIGALVCRRVLQLRQHVVGASIDAPLLEVLLAQLAWEAEMIRPLFMPPSPVEAVLRSAGNETQSQNGL